MAAMPFPFNGIWVVLGNLPKIFLVSSLIYASFFNPLFQFILEIVPVSKSRHAREGLIS